MARTEPEPMISELRDRYEKAFGSEPTADGEVDRIESELGVTLPDDFKRISEFYSGGIVGSISHYAIGEEGLADSVLRVTQELRDKIGLPPRFVVLADPPESLIVLNTQPSSDFPPVVIWCLTADVLRLGTLDVADRLITWSSYAKFFDYCLTEEESESRDA